MLQCILWSHTLGWIPLETTEKEVNEVFIPAVQGLGQVLAAWIPDLAARVLDDARRVVAVVEELRARRLGEQSGRRDAEHLHETRDLLDLVLAGEDGHARLQLGHDAAERPHVDREALRQPQDHLRRALEPRLDLRLHPLLHEARGPLVNHLDA